MLFELNDGDSAFVNLGNHFLKMVFDKDYDARIIARTMAMH